MGGCCCRCCCPRKKDGSVGGTVSKSLPISTKLHVTACFLLYTGEYVMTLSVYAYLSDLINDFGVVDNIEDVGYFSGFPMTSYYVGRLITALIWPALSNVKWIGRKKVLLLGGFFLFCTAVGLAFTFDYYYFLGWHFFLGLFCSMNETVAKTSMVEAVPPERVSTIFGILVFCFSAAQILGFLIGGFFARPFQQYDFVLTDMNHWANTFFHLYKFQRMSNLFPFFLPNMILAFILLLVFIFAVLFLKETNANCLPKKGQKEIGNRENEDSSDTSDSELNVVDEDQADEKVVKTTKKKGGIICEIFSFVPLTCLLVYFLIASSGGLLYKVFPVFVTLPVSGKGLGFRNFEIGILECVGGTFGIIGAFIAHQLMKCFGMVWCLRVVCFVQIIFVPFYPELSYLLVSGDFYLKLVMWGCLSVLIFFRENGYQVLYAGVMVCLSNSVHKKNLAYFQGLCLFVVAFARISSPVYGGILLSLSSSVDVFPFDIHFLFICTCFVLFLTGIATCFLPLDLKYSRDQLKRRKGKGKCFSEFCGRYQFKDLIRIDKSRIVEKKEEKNKAPSLENSLRNLKDD